MSIVGSDLLLGESGSEFRSDPKIAGRRVVESLHAGVDATITACVETSNALARFQDVPEKLRAFIDTLVDGKVISTGEARLGLSSPKLSKLRTVGEGASILSRAEIRPYLQPGYTILYATLILYQHIKGDEETRIELLGRLLASCETDLSHGS